MPGHAQVRPVRVARRKAMKMSRAIAQLLPVFQHVTPGSGDLMSAD